MGDEWLNRGLALAAAKRWGEALSCYDHALAEEPRNAKVWYKKGVALANLQRLEEALKCFEAATKLDAALPEAWFNRGSILTKLVRFREALECYEQAQKLGDPDAPKAISVCLRQFSQSEDRDGTHAAAPSPMPPVNPGIPSASVASRKSPGEGPVHGSKTVPESAPTNPETPLPITTGSASQAEHSPAQRSPDTPDFTIGQTNAGRFAWKVGQKIEGRWEIQKIFKGGMGVVYIVYDHVLRGTLAAKTFREEVYSLDPQIIERFKREALIWINIEAHQNIAQALFLETIKGRPFLFLEYVAGGNLGDWIRAGRLDPKLALAFALQFCDGMIHAASKGLTVHRDIKPQNCLIAELKLKETSLESVLKVSDFGLAKALAALDSLALERGVPDEGSGRITDSHYEQELGDGDLFVSPPDSAGLRIGQTATGIAIGTPAYMAPEQFDDAKRVDTRADVYSFGVMLYEMLAKRPLFKVHARNKKEFWEKWIYVHKHETPPIGPECFPVEEIIRNCLAKSPESRYADFAALRHNLDTAYQQLFGKYEDKIKELLVKQMGLKGKLKPQDERLINILAGKPNLQSEPAKLTPEGLAHKGRNLLNLGRFQEALGTFDDALRSDSRVAAAWEGRGLTLERLGQYEEANTCLERAAELDSQRQVFSSKGRILMRGGNYQGAVAAFDRALQLDPKCLDALTNKGIVLTLLKEYQDALACFERALQINSTHYLAWLGKGDVLSALGKEKEAQACYDREAEFNPQYDEEGLIDKGMMQLSRGRAASAIACFDRALMVNPGSIRALFERGFALASVRRYEEALSCYDRVLAINPNSAEAWNNKADTLNGALRLPEAINCCDRALQVNPRKRGAWNNKGRALFGLKRYEEALGCFDKAHELDPDDFKSLNNKGLVLTVLNRGAEALSVFDQILRRNPHLKEAWMGKAEALKNLHRLEEALGCLTRLLEIDPRFGPAWLQKAILLAGHSGSEAEARDCFEKAREFAEPGMAGFVEKVARESLPEASSEAAGAVTENTLREWVAEGVSQLEAGRPAEAILFFDRALKFDPQSVSVLTLKGTALNKAGQHDAAIELFDRALKVDPRHIAAWANKGAALCDLGRYSEALECCRSGRQIDSKVEMLWANEGAILAALNRDEEAVEACNQAIGLKPQDPNAWFNKGQALDALKRHDEALACFQRAHGLGHPRAAEMATRVTTVLQRPGGKPSSKAHNEAQQLWDRGNKFLEANECQRALELYDQALTLDPTFASAWLNKASALCRLGRNEEALTCCEHAAKVAPDEDACWNNKGIIFWALKRYEEALSCSERAVELNPRNADAWGRKGMALVVLGRLSEALLSFEKAQQLGLPNAAAGIKEVKRMLATPAAAREFCLKANTHANAGRFKDAAEAYDQALKVAPNLGEAWLGKATALSNLWRYDESFACYDRAVKLEDRNAMTWLMKGNELFSLGRLREALDCFRNASNEDPRLKDSWFKKGEALSALGRIDEAITCIEKAKALGHPAAAQELADLANMKSQGVGFSIRFQPLVLNHLKRSGPLNPEVESMVVKIGSLQAIGRHTEALHCCDEALKAHPKNPGFWYLKGECLAKGEKNLREALACFRKARELGFQDASRALAICEQSIAYSDICSAAETQRQAVLPDAQSQGAQAASTPPKPQPAAIQCKIAPAQLRMADGLCFQHQGKACKYSGSYYEASKEPKILPHGYGMLSYPDGSVYKGNWEHGQRSGHGTHTGSDGKQYEGYWQGDERNGKGAERTSDYTFSGNYLNGKMHGHGILVQKDGVRIEGEFDNDQPVGWIRQTDNRGNDLETLIEAGKEVRIRGLTVYSDGTKQKGEWDKLSGRGSGIIKWSDGREYEGPWLDNGCGKVDIPEGKGIMRMPDGRKFEGEFANGKMHGKGCVTYPDGRIERGIWKDGDLEAGERF